MEVLERISIEVSTRCAKACPFCYNHSNPLSDTAWDADDLLRFVLDCAANGVRAVSFGGGEPLQYEPLFDVLRELKGVLFRSVTTNGLPLTGEVFHRLVAAEPDKVHVSIHFPERQSEVDRVARQVVELSSRGLRSGVNLLVRRSTLEASRRAAESLFAAGLDHSRIVFLPVRGVGMDTPTPREVAWVAGDKPFQSMTCLGGCGRSARFCSIAADRTAAWCSYTASRRPLSGPTHAALVEALDGLAVSFCGGAA